MILKTIKIEVDIAVLVYARISEYDACMYMLMDKIMMLSLARSFACLSCARSAHEKIHSLHPYKLVYTFNCLFVFIQPSALVSNIGGALSLYLGIAIIMAFELVELLWDILTAFFVYCAHSRPTKG